MDKINHYIQHMHIKYCTEVSMQTYLCYAKDTRKSRSFLACCLHVCLAATVWLVQLGLQRAATLQGARWPGSPCLFFPVHRFQVCAVLCVFTWRLTAFIFALSPPLVFSCVAQQAAAAGAEGAFPGLFERGDADRSGWSVLQCCAELLWGELCALFSLFCS